MVIACQIELGLYSVSLMADAIEFILNGRAVRVESVSPNTTLLEYLRGTGLTGAKEGCAEGDCGACSVAIIDRDSQGQPCCRAINSCLVPLCLMAGREIVSVEGVAGRGKLHPVQEKIAQGHGSQCGYCTPGVIMSLFEGYYRGDIRNPAQLDDQLCGNLCRCTGYRPIREAAINAFQERHKENGQDSFAKRLEKSTAGLNAVEFEFAGQRFFRPVTLGALLQLVAQFPEGRLIAGATELGLDITKRFKKFPTLLSVEAVPELKKIERTDTEWRIGAAATLTEIEEQMADEFPVLANMLRAFGSRQIRNRATMGGNLVTASPIGDSAPLLLALNASVVLASLESRAGVPPAPPPLNRTEHRRPPCPALRTISPNQRVLRRLPQNGPASRRDPQDHPRAPVCPDGPHSQVRLVQGFKAPRDGHQHCRGMFHGGFRRARCRSARATRLRRRGGDARAGAQDRAGAARQAVV